MSSVWNNLFRRLLWNRPMRAVTLQLMRLLPLHRGRVMLLCWNGNRYGCNPKAISDAIAANPSWSARFEVWFAFRNPADYAACLPAGVHAVEVCSYDYYRLLATAQFVVSNIHCEPYYYPHKRRGQQYIFTGHGGSGIKKIEFDTDSLPAAYMKMAAADSARIDLFLSGSAFRSRVVRSAYRYQGEILEQGTPRNDAYIRSLQAMASHGVGDDNAGVGRDGNAASRHYLIYAPTFRANGRRDVYGFDVEGVVGALEKRFGGEWYIRISSHPNMSGYYREIYDFSHPRLIDVGGEDLQPLLATSDILLTDYSSAEMDFALTGRPVFQLCKDRGDYDRGFYIEPEEMPFPFATDDATLICNILDFDEKQYGASLARFHAEVIEPHETGHAAEAVVGWMLSKMYVVNDVISELRGE